jgi:hypothetical protein
MKYIFMVRDELGDERRAYGNEFIESEHTFPDYDQNDEAMQSAFLAWKNSMVERANTEFAEIYGDESSIFMEPLYSDMFAHMSLSQMEAYAECFF